MISVCEASLKTVFVKFAFEPDAAPLPPKSTTVNGCWVTGSMIGVVRTAARSGSFG